MKPITNILSQIIKTDSFDVVHEYLSQADQRTLIIFDADEVLFCATDTVLRHNQYLYEHIEQYASEEEISELYSIIFSQRGICPVDNRCAPLIASLQDNGIKVIVLTNCYTEQFGRIASMKDWRINDLKKIGYHFERSWHELAEKKFDQLPTQQADLFPLFSQGILFTNDVPKGDVLDAFLEYAAYKPDTIIFIDDRMSYLESVQKVTEKRKISFLGIHYPTSLHINVPQFCPIRVEHQIKTLIKEKKWLSDNEADKLLSKK